MYNDDSIISSVIVLFLGLNDVIVTQYMAFNNDVIAM